MSWRFEIFVRNLKEMFNADSTLFLCTKMKLTSITLLYCQNSFYFTSLDSSREESFPFSLADLSQASFARSSTVDVHLTIEMGFSGAKFKSQPSVRAFPCFPIQRNGSPIFVRVTGASERTKSWCYEEPAR